jgi:hypothetical protein
MNIETSFHTTLFDIKIIYSSLVQEMFTRMIISRDIFLIKISRDIFIVFLFFFTLGGAPDFEILINSWPQWVVKMIKVSLESDGV